MVGLGRWMARSGRLGLSVFTSQGVVSSAARDQRLPLSSVFLQQPQSSLLRWQACAPTERNLLKQSKRVGKGERDAAPRQNVAPAACLQRKHEVHVKLLGTSTDLQTGRKDANENERHPKTTRLNSFERGKVKLRRSRCGGLHET